MIWVVLIIRRWIAAIFGGLFGSGGQFAMILLFDMTKKMRIVIV